MAYEVVMSYHLHMPSYFLGTFTEYPYSNNVDKQKKGYRGHLPVSFFCFICFPYLCRKYMLLYFNAFVLQCNVQNFCIVGILLFIQSSFH